MGSRSTAAPRSEGVGRGRWLEEEGSGGMLRGKRGQG
jgi:hypothetical protein